MTLTEQYLYEISENTYDISNDTIDIVSIVDDIRNQQKAMKESGEILLQRMENNQKEAINALGIVSFAIIFLLLMLFIERCLK